MKGKFLITTSLVLASVCTSAQNYFGVTGGYNLSTFKMDKQRLGIPDGVVENSPKSGFNAGIAYEYRFTGSDKGNLFIGANVLYSLEGYHHKALVPAGMSVYPDMVRDNTDNMTGKNMTWTEEQLIIQIEKYNPEDGTANRDYIINNLNIKDTVDKYLELVV